MIRLWTLLAFFGVADVLAELYPLPVRPVRLMIADHVISPLHLSIADSSVTALLVEGDFQVGVLAQPQIKIMKAMWDAYPLLPGMSNVTFTLYKSTSLGLVYTPFKPTAVTVWPRTNLSFTVLPGSYKFRLTMSCQPYGETMWSNITTNTIAP